MSRLIGNIALAAALVAVLASLLRDHGTLVALKRATISYLAFYFVAGVLALVYRWGVDAEPKQAREPPGTKDVEPGDPGTVRKSAG